MLVQVFENILPPRPSSEAALSQTLHELLEEFLAADDASLEQLSDQAQVGEHWRMPQRLVGEDDTAHGTRPADRKGCGVWQFHGRRESVLRGSLRCAALTWFGGLGVASRRRGRRWAHDSGQTPLAVAMLFVTAALRRRVMLP